MLIEPDFSSFEAKCAEGNLVPVWGEVLADLETPVSAFKKFEDSEFAFLLESVEQGDQVGRYSFLGFDPEITLSSRDHEVIVRERSGKTETHTCENPMHFVRDYMKRFQPVADDRLPPFIGGAVGFMSYDIVRQFEKLPDSNPDDLQLPDCHFMIADAVLAFDHVRRRILIIVNAHVNGDAQAAYDTAIERIRAIEYELQHRSLTDHQEAGTGTPVADAQVASNMAPEDYMDAVERIREYTRAGDVFQVVLSQRFSRPYAGLPFDVYRALRAVNPSPYMFYLKYGAMKLAGSSPEILVTVNDGEVNVRPIAGTRRRGKDSEEDAALEAELLADPKERAEHIMLIDLGRNDCGRVSVPGSVKVDRLMIVEHYSHVMHIVSNVVGKLAADKDGFDVLEATFPAGTLSGAPKIRAMEVIDELEKSRRGAYGGACGYFGFNGNVDTCITIRTVLLKDGMAVVQAGAGIVADSVPADEQQECINKARGMFAAIEMAEKGLD